MNENGELELSPLDPSMRTPFTTVDPCAPDLDRHPRFRYAKPITVTVSEGQMLYLPGISNLHLAFSVMTFLTPFVE
jgi:jumonji domain-containing protein 7